MGLPYMPISWGGKLGVNGAVYMAVPWVVSGYCSNETNNHKTATLPAPGPGFTTDPSARKAAKAVIVD